MMLVNLVTRYVVVGMNVKIKNNIMIFYHGTSKENWKEIQKEGVLYGRRYVIDGNEKHEINRCTYLAVDREEAECYGDIVR